MFKILITLGFAFLVGCSGPHYNDFFPYREDGTCKPKVVFLPVKDGTLAHQTVVDNLDQSIRYRLMDRGSLFCYSFGEIQPVFEKHQDKETDQLADYFHPADFVIQVELLQNELTTCSEIYSFVSNPQRLAKVVAIQLKIFDIRHGKPELILLELTKKTPTYSYRDERDCLPSVIYEKISEEITRQIERTIKHKVTYG